MGKKRKKFSLEIDEILNKNNFERWMNDAKNLKDGVDSFNGKLEATVISNHNDTENIENAYEKIEKAKKYFENGVFDHESEKLLREFFYLIQDLSFDRNIDKEHYKNLSYNYPKLEEEHQDKKQRTVPAIKTSSVNSDTSKDGIPIYNITQPQDKNPSGSEFEQNGDIRKSLDFLFNPSYFFPNANLGGDQPKQEKEEHQDKKQPTHLSGAGKALFSNKMLQTPFRVPPKPAPPAREGTLKEESFERWMQEFEKSNNLSDGGNDNCFQVPKTEDFIAEMQYLPDGYEEPMDYVNKLLKEVKKTSVKVVDKIDLEVRCCKKLLVFFQKLQGTCKTQISNKIYDQSLSKIKDDIEHFPEESLFKKLVDFIYENGTDIDWNNISKWPDDEYFPQELKGHFTLYKSFNDYKIYYEYITPSIFYNFFELKNYNFLKVAAEKNVHDEAIDKFGSFSYNSSFSTDFSSMNIKNSLELLQKAAKKDNSFAMFWLGRFYASNIAFESSKKINYKEKISYLFQRAYKLTKSPHIKYYMTYYCFELGYSGKVDMNKAFEYYESIKDSSVNATLKLIDFYSKGLTPEGKNLEHAKELCQDLNGHDLKMLELLDSEGKQDEELEKDRYSLYERAVNNNLDWNKKYVTKLAKFYLDQKAYDKLEHYYKVMIEQGLNVDEIFNETLSLYNANKFKEIDVKLLLLGFDRYNKPEEIKNPFSVLGKIEQEIESLDKKDRQTNNDLKYILTRVCKKYGNNKNIKNLFKKLDNYLKEENYFPDSKGEYDIEEFNSSFGIEAEGVLPEGGATINDLKDQINPAICTIKKELFLKESAEENVEEFEIVSRILESNDDVNFVTSFIDKVKNYLKGKATSKSGFHVHIGIKESLKGNSIKHHKKLKNINCTEAEAEQAVIKYFLFYYHAYAYPFLDKIRSSNSYCINTLFPDNVLLDEKSVDKAYEEFCKYTLSNRDKESKENKNSEYFNNLTKVLAAENILDHKVIPNYRGLLVNLNQADSTNTSNTTIEVRHHQGMLDSKQIKLWLKFLNDVLGHSINTAASFLKLKEISEVEEKDPEVEEKKLLTLKLNAMNTLKIGAVETAKAASEYNETLVSKKDDLMDISSKKSQDKVSTKLLNCQIFPTTNYLKAIC